MKKILSFIYLSIACLASAYAGDMEHYKVSITNTTAHHVFTPQLLITHSKGVRLFSIGQPASEGLAYQAEFGDPSMFLAEAQSHAGVMDTVVGDFIPHGMTATYIIAARKKARLTWTTMLATTNDGFAALNSVKLPTKSVTYHAYAHDAGSEGNNEDCAFIPGPPCAPASGNSRNTAEAEGFITIHNGVHGQGDLSPQDLDWRGPVAIVTITRIKD